MATDNTSVPGEIQRFNHLASTWWDDNGPMWPLHLLNRFRVKVILDVLASKNIISADSDLPLQGFNVLDIGCGGGILSESLHNLGARVTGIDLAEKNIQIAQQHAARQNLDIRYLCQEVSSLKKEFDLVFNMEVVEHVGNLKTFMMACNEKVKPGGHMFVATINRTLKSFLFAIIGAEFILRLLPRGTHNWQCFVTPDEIKVLLKKGNMDTQWISGIAMNPFNRQFRLTRSTSVNYMLLASNQE